MTEWRARAACRGMPVDLFFRDQGPPRWIQRMCVEVCPVRQECIEDAIAQGDTEFGWRGQKAATAHRARIRAKSPRTPHIPNT